MLAGLGLGGLATALPAWLRHGQAPLPGGPDLRDLTTAFPDKGPMILQRTRPPLLETPFEVFDQGVFTPRPLLRALALGLDPHEVDANAYRLTVRGHVDRAVAVARRARPAAALRDRRRQPMLGQFRACSSRGCRAQWANGSMGNARWTACA